MQRKMIMQILGLVLVGSIVGVSIYLNLPSPIEPQPSVSINFCKKPVSSIDEISNDTQWAMFHDFVISPSLDSEMAPDDGNLYAPEIVIVNGSYFMWYGAQSSEGHDSIHFATSDDGRDWYKYGTVIPTAENNHVNDPSVVVVNNTFFMYYTVAPLAELDEIWLATSENGFDWDIFGCVLNQSDSAEEWDSLKVGRPSVLYEEGVYKMWFDGTQRSAEDPTAVREGTGRHVGYATSSDGYNWTKFPSNPIFYNSGALDVEKIDDHYVVVEESGLGILYRVSENETAFPLENSWLFQKVNNTMDQFGHVTPFILVKDGKWVATYTGAATSKTWNQNRISVWYPMENILLKDENASGDDVFYKPLAYSDSLLQWDLGELDLGKTLGLRYQQGSDLMDYHEIVCQDENYSFFFLDDQIIQLV